MPLPKTKELGKGKKSLLFVKLVHMERRTQGALTWLIFDLFTQFPRLIHGSFLRHGGVSEGSFTSLNFGILQGELPENISINQARALSALNLSHCCALWQEHGTKVIQATVGPKEYGDALTTNQKELGLSILHADCQAAIFYDPIHHAVTNVHCGWKGSVQNIYQTTIEAMKSLYGSRAADLHVGISPSLGPNAAEFIHFEKELPTTFYPFQIKPCYFDFWQISLWQLMQCGILSHHIEIAEICTYTNSEDCFSYRRLKSSGRHATFAALR